MHISNNIQTDFFKPVAAAYAAGGELSNEALYAQLEASTCLPASIWDERAAVDASGQLYSLAKRKVRWIQQTLRELCAIEHVPGKRGVWRAVARGDDELTKAQPGVALVAFSTDLGLALWSDAKSVFSKITEPIHLILTSPPYPLQKARAYGGPTEKQFVDFVCTELEPLVRNLVPGGSLCLNISNDIFLQGSPARSLYLERTVLAIHDRLGLFLQDRLIWENPTKPPGPTMWACKTRQQLSHTWEPILWFTNDPSNCFADNRRVLRQHSDRQTKLIAAGGEQRSAVYGDGAYTLKPGSFGHATIGSIPRNILRYAQSSREVQETRATALANGLPTHGATMPVKLAKFLIEFLTPPNSLVADPFGGWCTTGLAAQEAGRRWIVTERIAQYVAGASWRFRHAPGHQASFDLSR